MGYERQSWSVACVAVSAGRQPDMGEARRQSHLRDGYSPTAIIVQYAVASFLTAFASRWQ